MIGETLCVTLFLISIFYMVYSIEKSNTVKKIKDINKF